MASMLLGRLKQRIKRHPRTFEWFVSLILLKNRIFFEVGTWPESFGRSRMDKLKNRRLLGKNLLLKSELASTWDAQLEGAILEDDSIYESLCNDVGLEVPISFSWPGEITDVESDISKRPRVFSEVFPGNPYSFADYSSYTKQYRESQIGASFKKAGWDCFRHLEILNAGALLYMPDADQIPELAMSHYPKRLLRLAKVRVEAGLPVEKKLNDAIRLRFEGRLTSIAMAGFILDRVSARGKRVVFLDLDLDTRPDYLSVMTYVGMKQILGRDGCIAPLGAKPVFDDWQGDGSNLHGLGFGYTRVLSKNVRSPLEVGIASIADFLSGLNPEDFVIVGNISVRPELAKIVDKLLSKAIGRAYIWGGDRPPGRTERKWIKALNGYLLYRERY